MAAGSQYHRGATGPHSHYHALPSNPEHLYSDLTASWHSSHGFSQASASSALLQRFSSPAQRAIASHYFNYGGPNDYVNPPTQAQPAWPANYRYIRPAAQGWSETVGDDSFTTRALPYSAVESRAPVPHHDTARPQQPQHASEAGQVALLNAPREGYRAPEPQPEQRALPELTAAPNAPPYQPQSSTAAPIARPMNYPTPGLHVNPPHASSQVPVGWSAGTSSDVPQPSPPQHIGHTNNPLSSGVVLAGNRNLPSPPWGMPNSGPASATSPIYEHVPQADHEWSPVESQPDNSGYLYSAHSARQFPRTLAAPRGGRRVASKKGVPKVPAAFVQRQEKLKVSKRAGPLTEDKRLNTHQMRKDRATCIRCRFYKSGCNPGASCNKCLKVDGNARSFMLPCIRDRLEDASLVRHCNGRSNQEEGEFLGYDWIHGSHLHNMDLVWNLPAYGPIAANRPMRITYRQYHPKRPLLDVATSVWSNSEGHVKVVEQPPYAIYDTASLVPSFERYFSGLQPAIEEWIFDRIQDDEIALLTYHEVIRVRAKQQPGPRNLLDLAMRVQCLSIVSQGYGSVWSNDIPGIQEYDFTKMGHSAYEAYDRKSRDRPLPGAINHQMDVAALKYLKKLEKLCVKELSSQVFKSKIKPWYELFLALYVLYWNMQYIHEGAERYIMSKNGTGIENHVSSVVNNQLKKWEWAFQVLNNHWMAILRDFRPFKLARENPEELRQNGHLDAEAFNYVTRVSRLFEQLPFGQSTSPFIGVPRTHNSLSSEWIKTLFKEAGAFS